MSGWTMESLRWFLLTEDEFRISLLTFSRNHKNRKEENAQQISIRNSRVVEVKELCASIITAESKTA